MAQSHFTCLPVVRGPVPGLFASLNFLATRPGKTYTQQTARRGDLHELNRTVFPRRLRLLHQLLLRTNLADSTVQPGVLTRARKSHVHSSRVLPFRSLSNAELLLDVPGADVIGLILLLWI